MVILLNSGPRIPDKYVHFQRIGEMCKISLFHSRFLIMNKKVDMLDFMCEQPTNILKGYK